MIKAHEIQGCSRWRTASTASGLDHVVLVKVASTAVVAQHAGLHARRDHQRAVAGLGRRPVRCAPTATRPTPGSRKSWAAGDATVARRAPGADREDRRDGLSLGADRARPGVSTTCCSSGKPFNFQRPYGSYVMENVLFKISFPAEFHAQTAVECGDAAASAGERTRLEARGHQEDHDPHARVGDPHHRQERPARQPGRPRPLHPVHGGGAAHLRAADGRRTTRTASPPIPRIDALRDKMVCVEDARFTKDYLDPDKRSIANAHHRRVQRRQEDCSEIVVEYPIGHRRRRKEGIPVLVEKFRDNLARRFAAKQQRRSSTGARSEEARRHAGPRVRRPDGRLIRP